jgi:hypothetical protein
MMIAITRQFSVLAGRQLAKEQTDHNQHLASALTRLHARACQVAAEILALMQHGFADGAMARWRTLHEIAVIATFLRDRGEVMAERYHASGVLDGHRAAIDFLRSLMETL